VLDRKINIGKHRYTVSKPLEFDRFKGNNFHIHSTQNMTHTKKVIVKETEISFMNKEIGEYISLTDIAKYRSSVEPFSIINNWMRSRSTIEFLGL